VSRIRVAFVEDDDDVRVATARLLTAAGYTVQTYNSSSDFMARLPAANPGCVVLDIRLPDQSGLELQELLVHAQVTVEGGSGGYP